MKTWPDFGLGACLAASDCWLTMIFSLFELFVQIHWAGWTITVPVQIPGQGILDSLPSIHLSVSPSSAVTAPFLLNFFTSLSLSSATFYKIFDLVNACVKRLPHQMFRVKRVAILQKKTDAVKFKLLCWARHSQPCSCAHQLYWWSWYRVQHIGKKKT